MVQYHKYVCKCCGKKFKSKNRGRMYCSIKCSAKYNSKKRPLVLYKHICKNCGKEFESRVRVVKYCSMKCYHNTRIVNVINEMTCPICNKKFKPPRDNSIYCSKKCMYIGRRNEHNFDVSKKTNFKPSWEYIKHYIYACIISSYNICKNALKLELKSDYREYPDGTPYIGERYGSKPSDSLAKDCWEFLFGLDEGKINDYIEALDCYGAIKMYRKLLLNGFNGDTIPDARLNGAVNLKSYYEMRERSEVDVFKPFN